MSSPEYEGFGMSDRDILDALDPLRRQKKRSKEEAIYGMWADDDDDNATGRAGFGSDKGPKDYSRPVSFISGGFKGEEEEEESSKNSESIGTQKPTTTTSKFTGSKRIAGMQQKGATADFERHTKGIGTKLLGKMGWKSGQGLGKNNQGINRPVEAHVRKGKGALGFYGSERKEPVLPQSDALFPSDKKTGAAIQAQNLGQWKKTTGEKKKKVQYVVKTAADIAADADWKTTRGIKASSANDALTGVKVIDLTGKEKVVYSGYSSISRHHAQSIDDEFDKPEHFDVAELRHNLKTLIETVEDEVIENLQIQDRETNQLATLEHDKYRLDEAILEEERQIERLDKVMERVDEVSSSKTLDGAISGMERLKIESESDYKMYSLDRLLYPLSEPLLRSQFSSWSPLTPSQSSMSLDTMTKLRKLFFEADLNSGVRYELFDSLMWEIWAPPVRQAIMNNWNPRDSDCLIDFLEKWYPIIPPWIWDNLTDQFIIPRIQVEAENWNPVTDKLPIHSWIHPWLSLLSTKLEPVYVPIRQKIGMALNSWHPSDQSAKILLSSWIKVWSDGQMRSFLLQHIAPKLEKVMQEFEINPRQQNLNPWKWVFAWIDLIPHPFFVSMLEKHFFPKWLHCLGTWLDSGSADYQEISKWYLGWKSSVPAVIVEEPNVKENLGKALAMMNVSLTGGKAMSILTPQTQFVPPPPPPPPPQIAAQPVPVTFKEIIERRAEADGIIFMPLGRRDGQQVYQLGRVVVYIDRNVVFVSSGQSWQPVSLDELFTMT